MEKTKDISNYFGKKTSEEAIKEIQKIPIESVPGLLLIKDFITKAEEDQLLTEINKMPWSNKLKRRVQQYGYEYDYTSRNAANSLGPLPDFLTFTVDRIMEHSLSTMRPDQCIVNEYEPGQGISNHVDIPHLFGDEIISISLASDVIMEFTSPDSKKVSVLLPRRSAVILEGDARYKWKHGIPARKKDQLENGNVLIRGKRISLTYRYMKKKIPK